MVYLEHPPFITQLLDENFSAEKLNGYLKSVEKASFKTEMYLDD
ncbi:MAG: hypothetical protein ACTSPG_05405 [Candidatus Hodarchaeales archaeon]